MPPEQRRKREGRSKGRANISQPRAEGTAAHGAFGPAVLLTDRADVGFGPAPNDTDGV